MTTLGNCLQCGFRPLLRWSDDEMYCANCSTGYSWSEEYHRWIALYCEDPETIEAMAQMYSREQNASEEACVTFLYDDTLFASLDDVDDSYPPADWIPEEYDDAEFGPPDDFGWPDSAAGMV